MMINWNWSLLLQDWHLLIARHPKILFFSSALLFLIAYFRRLYWSVNSIVNWPVAGMIPAVIANSHRLQDLAADGLEEFGGTFMFKGPWFCGMDFVLTCSPANANHMFNVNFSNYPKGARFADMFDVLGDGIFSSDGDSWVVQRRMAHAHMSHPRFRTSVVECTRDKVVKVLFPLLNHMAEFDKVVDLSDVFMRFTFDTTCKLVLGVDPGCLASEFPIVPFAKALDEIEQVLLLRHVFPMIWWKLLRWLRVGKERKMAEATEVVDQFIAKHIQERRETLKVINHAGSSSDMEQGPTDLLGQYMDYSVVDNVGEHSSSSASNDKFLRDTLLTFLTAGKETTGAALVWFFWLVAIHPNIEKKILNELSDQVTKEHSNLNEDELVVFNAEEVDTLVYFHASFCETLRIYPPVPFNHKEALKADILPSGHVVQPGTKVIFSAYAMGKMEECWGNDRLEFKPERWITEKGLFKHEPSYKFIAFHSGPRSCLGKNMAFTQMKLVAAAVIYNYKFELVEGHITEPKPSVVLQAKNGLMVKLKKRRTNELYGN